MASIFKPKGSDKYVIFYIDHTGRRRKKTLVFFEQSRLTTNERKTTSMHSRDMTSRGQRRSRCFASVKCFWPSIKSQRPATSHTTENMVSDIMAPPFDLPDAIVREAPWWCAKNRGAA